MTRRRLARILGVVAPLAAIVVVLVVLHGAGVPLTLPGIIVAVLVLIVGRVIGVYARRRRPERR